MFSFRTSAPLYTIHNWVGSGSLHPRLRVHARVRKVEHFNAGLRATLDSLTGTHVDEQALFMHHSLYIMCHCHLGEDGNIVVHGKDVTDSVREATAREFNKNVLTKKQFVSHIFHEIRNALDAVSLSVDELRDACLSIDHAVFKRMDDHIHLIVDVLDDVVTFDNFTSLPGSIKSKVFMLDDLFKNCVYMMHAYINTRTLLFTHHNAAPHVAVKGDYMKLKQVILHLLTNSANYTRGNGQVEMRVNADVDCFVRVEIGNVHGGADHMQTGEDERADVITEILDHATAVRAAGSAGKHTRGLALSIVKQIVELHGGTFGYREEKSSSSSNSSNSSGSGSERGGSVSSGESGLKRGMVFYFTLPVHVRAETLVVDALPSAPALDFVSDMATEGSTSSKMDASSAVHDTKHATATAALLTTVRVLVVDDNLVILKLMRNMLSRLGVNDLSVASDGQEAINYYSTALHKGTPFTHVLMDQEMPHVDGNAATRAIVDMHPDANVIGVTGNCSEQQRHAFMAHGARQVVNKPVNKDVLLNVLCETTRVF